MTLIERIKYKYQTLKGKTKKYQKKLLFNDEMRPIYISTIGVIMQNGN